MASRIVLVLALALGSNAFGPTLPQCPSEQTRESESECTEAGTRCFIPFNCRPVDGEPDACNFYAGTCFATEGDAFICGCCEAGEGYEDASGNALPLCITE